MLPGIFKPSLRCAGYFWDIRSLVDLAVTTVLLCLIVLSEAWCFKPAPMGKSRPAECLRTVRALCAMTVIIVLKLLVPFARQGSSRLILSNNQPSNISWNILHTTASHYSNDWRWAHIEYRSPCRCKRLGITVLSPVLSPVFRSHHP